MKKQQKDILNGITGQCGHLIKDCYLFIVFFFNRTADIMFITDKGAPRACKFDLLSCKLLLYNL
jgi:hypothetical protein